MNVSAGRRCQQRVEAAQVAGAEAQLQRASHDAEQREQLRRDFEQQLGEAAVGLQRLAGELRAQVWQLTPPAVCQLRAAWCLSVKSCVVRAGAAARGGAAR
jgi:hypothetical protein